MKVTTSSRTDSSFAVPGVVHFRPALPSEVGLLEELQRRTAMVSNYREQILAHPDAIEIPIQAVLDGQARVAVDAGGRILGFSIVLPLADGLAELDALFVEPEFAKCGIGRALLDDAFSIARGQGVRRMEVIANLEAAGFYEKIGFVGDGPVATRFAPALRMHMDIASSSARSPANALRVLVFGNSGSGKSTLARKLAAAHGLKMLDLDQVVWSRTDFAKFRPDEDIIGELDCFVSANVSWIVEGCYGRWMEYLQSRCTRMVFLNPGQEACLANCRARPWEPEKYPTRAEQDARLPFLLDWVCGYYSRTDDLSLSAHRRLFDSFTCPKEEINTTLMSTTSEEEEA